MSAAQPAAAPVPSNAPAWAVAMRRFNNWWLNDLFGGPRVVKFAWVINAQKAGTFFFLGALMWYYAGKTPAATSTAAWIYLALHGSYGLVWLLKDMTFPDPGWQVRVTWGSVVAGMLGLGMYWSFGWLLISGTSQPDYPLADGPWFCLCISLVMLGSVIMIAADCQKYYTLRVKRGLITDGMHKYIRHPNYLGEMMIYGSFALTGRPLAAVAVARLRLDRPLRRQHGDEGSQHVAVPGMGGLQATHVVAGALRLLTAHTPPMRRCRPRAESVWSMMLPSRSCISITAFFTRARLSLHDTTQQALTWQQATATAAAQTHGFP